MKRMFLKLKETFGLVGAAKVMVSHLIKFKIVSVNLKKFENHIKFRPYTGDFATIRQIIWDQEYDLNLPRYPDFIIDLGANIGLFSMALATKYPKSRIIAVEPDRENFEILCFNTQKYKNIIKINKAIWIKDEMVSLENPAAKTNSFIFRKSILGHNENLCEAISLNSLMKEFNILKIGLLKVDIEGVEKEIFLDSNNSWIPKVDFISIEFHDNDVANKISNLLKSMSFDVRNQKGEKKNFINLREN